MQKRTIWVRGALTLAVATVLLFALGVFDGLLASAGSFMAPVREPGGTVDAVVVEGTAQVDTELANLALSLLAERKVGRIFFVVAGDGRTELGDAFRGDLSSRLEDSAEKQRAEHEVVSIIRTPLEHPVTLRSARVAIEVLSKQGVKRAILLTSGFHARRSYLTYQYLGDQHQMQFYPQASFAGHVHGKERWWTQRTAALHFLEQSLKLVYYMIRGYIPFKLSY